MEVREEVREEGRGERKGEGGGRRTEGGERGKGYPHPHWRQFGAYISLRLEERESLVSGET